MIPIRPGELFRYLGYRKGAVPEGEVLARIEICEKQLQAAAEPRSLFLRVPVLHCPDGSLQIAGMEIRSRDLAGNLEGCQEVFLFAATLGLGPDRLISRASAGRVSDAVIYQAMSAEMIESYCNQENARLRELAAKEGLFLRPRFSPGYGDLPLDLQKDLLRILHAAKKIGLTLTDSLLMIPSKSVTAFIGITEEVQPDHDRDCENCKMADCSFRKETLP